MRDTTKEGEEIVEQFKETNIYQTARVSGYGKKMEDWLRNILTTLLIQKNAEIEAAVEAGRQEVWEQIKQQANRDETGMYMFYLADTTPTNPDKTP